MPLYQYHCHSCGPFDLMNPMEKAGEPANCPSCKAQSNRNIAAPYLGAKCRNTIKVASRNERARHEPRHSAEHSHQHGKSGRCCGANSGRITGKTLSNAAGDKMFPSKRPWMISH